MPVTSAVSKKLHKRMLMKLTPGVYLTNILWTAFICADPKSSKRHWWLNCLFGLLGSAFVKAACKHVDEIASCGQFHQHVYERLFRTNSTFAQKSCQTNCTNHFCMKFMLGSISSMFYARIFHTKVLCAAFI